jgi:hypothetical protein
MIRFFRKLFGRKAPAKSEPVRISKDGYECAYLKSLNTPDAEAEVHFRVKDTMFLKLNTKVRVAYGYDSIIGEITAIFRSGFEVRSWSYDGSEFYENFRYSSLLGVLK